MCTQHCGICVNEKHLNYSTYIIININELTYTSIITIDAFVFEITRQHDFTTRVDEKINKTLKLIH